MEDWLNYTTQTFDEEDYKLDLLGYEYYKIGMKSSLFFDIPNYHIEDYDVDSYILRLGKIFDYVELEVAKYKHTTKDGKLSFHIPKEIYDRFGRQILTKVSKYKKYIKYGNKTVKIRFSLDGQFAEIVFFKEYYWMDKQNFIIPYQTEGRKDTLLFYGVNPYCGYFIRTENLGTFFDCYFSKKDVNSLLLDPSNLYAPLDELYYHK